MKAKVISSIVGVFFILFCGFYVSYANKFTFEGSWKKVYEFEKKSLPISALKEVEKIHKTAVKENNSPQAIKSLIYKLKFESQKSPDAIVKHIADIESLILNTTDKIALSVLHSMLGEMYIEYYNKDAYKINNRSTIAHHIPEKIENWSGNIFIDKFIEHMDASLQNSEVLKKTNTSAYAEILEMGEDSRYLRPTMFDFLSFRYLSLLNNHQHNVNKYFQNKKNEDENYLSDKELFINQKTENDSLSFFSKSIDIYRNLVSFHLQNNHQDALIHCDLERLKFVYQNSDMEIKDSLYVATLLKMKNEYQHSPICIEVFAEEANFHLLKDNKTKAYEICKTGIKKQPNYRRINLLKNIITTLENPSISCNTKNIVYPNTKLTFEIEHKNIKKLSLHVYKIEKSIDEYSAEKDNEIERNTTSKNQLVFSKEITLTLPQPNFSVQDTSIFIDGLKEGIYEFEVLTDNKLANHSAPKGSFFVTKSILLKRNGKEKIEYYAFNRKTGHPEPNASIQLFERKYEKQQAVFRKIAELKCDKNGFATYQTKENKTVYATVILEHDKSYPFDNFYAYNPFHKLNPEKSVENIFIFTDRNMYRPEQTVYFKAIATNQTTENSTPIVNKSYTITLTDVNNQKIAEKTISTNDFGSLSGAFILPKEVLSGYFSIVCGNHSQSFRVEEYKRPSIEIITEKIKETYSFGDTVLVKGNVFNYAGYGSAFAQIKYRIVRRTMFTKRFFHASEKEIQHGNINADATGKFSLSFVPQKSKEDKNDLNITYTYIVYLEATDSKGETQQTESQVIIGDNNIILTSNITEYVKKDENKNMVVSARNLNGEDIKIPVEYSIWKIKEKKDIQDTAVLIEKKVASGNIDLTKQTEINSNVLHSLPSGKYRLTLNAYDNKNRKSSSEFDFILFASADKRPPHKEYVFVDKHKTECKVGENAEILFGTAAENVRVMYQLVKNNEILETNFLLFNNELKMLKIPYKKEYEDEISLLLTFVKDEQFFIENIALKKKQDQDSLQIKLISFRDKLKPGEKENWLLKIVDNQNKIVNAELLAGLYDASLDKFGKHQWFFHSNRLFRYNENAIWNVKNVEQSNFYGYFNSDFLPTKEFQFDTFNWFGYEVSQYNDAVFFMTGYDKNIRFARVQAATEQEESMATGSMLTKEKEESKIPTNIQIRENFNETAFFYPQLNTNEKGEILLSFTMPESLTRWNFMGLAHTKDLKHGKIEASIVTQKPFMISANIPRFVREKDKINLTANIVNLTEKDIRGKVFLEIFNPENEEIVSKQEMNFETKKNNTNTIAFISYIPEKYSLLGFRFIAQNAEFSDGEQHLLAILPNKTLVTETLPMSISGKTLSKTYRFESLLTNQSTTKQNKRLVIEFSSNPAWYAVQALPTISNPENENTLSVFSAYFVNSLSAFIANSNPSIKSTFQQWKKTENSTALQSNLEKNTELKNIILDESPWLLEAKNENEQKHQIALLFDENNLKNKNAILLEKLKELQLENGAFCWFKGMQENRYVTHFVLDGLSKLSSTNGFEKNESIEEIKDKAIKYIDFCIKKDVEQLKKQSKHYKKEQHLSAEQIYYHYIRTSYKNIAVENDSKEAFDYYLTQIEKYWTKRSLYEQALIAITLHRNGKTNIATDILKSLREHAFIDEEKGMFWDKNRYGYYWYQSPIKTQTAIIEAFAEIKNDKSEIDQMKMWLLKEKQTQAWDSDVSTLHAIYALLLKGNNWLEKKENVSVFVNKTLLNETTELGTGYFKKTYESNDIKPELGNIVIEKKDEGMAWGAAYWQYVENLENISSSETNISISKKLFIEKMSENGKIIEPLDVHQDLKVGDKVIVRLEFSTTQNMEYVYLKDQRAACFEPVEQLSGYKWKEGLGYYQTTKDASTQFFFDFLPIGSYVLEYPVWVTHTGEFSNGIASIQCQYAPEFKSHTTSESVKVK